MIKSIIVGSLIVYIAICVYIYFGFKTVDFAIKLLEKDNIFFKYDEFKHYKLVAIICTIFWPILIVPMVIFGLIDYFKDK